MELKEIKRINQEIYELDADISRSNKVIFVSTLLFCLAGNKEFQNPNKLTGLINFTDEKKKPIDQLITIAKESIIKLNLSERTQDAVFNSMKTIAGVNTNIDRDREKFKNFVLDFVSNIYPSIKEEDLFLETLYMEIDRKAKNIDRGIVLTPIFAAELMVDLANIDYKKDIVADLCSGTGLFSLLAYSRMLKDMKADLDKKLITQTEYNKYQKRLFNSIIANDNEPKMVTLCLANFLLKSLNYELLFYEDVLKLERSSFKIKDNEVEKKVQATKAILNPPYEDSYKPLEILEKNISLVKQDGSKGNKVVVIIPPQKFGNKKDIFSKILNLATLESIIKMQDDLFTDSGNSPAASIFVFNVDKPHAKEDVIKYYNFTDTGYIYLKDSGLVDKNNTYNEKKAILLDKMAGGTKCKQNKIKRTWTNFYEVYKELEIETIIDPNRIRVDKEEADITLENITIKKMLKEKEELIRECNNNFKDKDGAFEKYIIDILSED